MIDTKRYVAIEVAASEVVNHKPLGLYSRAVAECADRIRHNEDHEMLSIIESQRRVLAAIESDMAANNERRRLFFARLTLREDGEQPLGAAEVGRLRAEFEAFAEEWRVLEERKLRITEAP